MTKRICITVSIRIFALMRLLGIICLFIAASIVLAHSVFPHHHHVEQEQAIHIKDNDHHHDSDHHNDTDHHNDNADDHQHNLFTFGQIEDTFLTGKQVMVPIAIAPVIEVFEWSFVVYTNQEPSNFYIKDIELPLWIRCQEISFRGPPSL